MSDILEKIAAYKRDEIAAAKAARPQNEVERAARAAAPPRGFLRAIQRRLAAGDYALIAEIKRASPSKGLIREDFDPATLAQAYQAGGAACLSVLTDGPSFQGRPGHLAAARESTRLPVLRKDFMLDPYQIVEARALGADCVLLIMAALDDHMARELEETALAHRLDVLIEVHNEAELDRALGLKSRLIGVNNRDLATLEVDLGVTLRLARLVPPERLLVSESGIHTRTQIARLMRAGAKAFLVGESLMRQRDVTAATRALLGEPAAETAGA